MKFLIITLLLIAVIAFVISIMNIEVYTSEKGGMPKVIVPIINTNPRGLPQYGTRNSSGADLYAMIAEPITLKPLERCVISTGIKISLPQGYEAQVRPRSGLSAKHGIVVALGTIDNDYRGDVGVIIINLSNEEYTITPNEKIGQLVIAAAVQADWLLVESLDETERAEGGFGHTGK